MGKGIEMSEPKTWFEALKSKLGDKIVSLEGDGFDAVIWLTTAGLRPALEALKAQYGFNVLVDLTAVDFSKHAGKNEIKPDLSHRFKLVYRLMNLDPQSGLIQGRLAVASWLDGEKGPVSVRDLWPCADWLEREVWDMFGIRFADRPDIKRILLYEEFKGHPLRKDYPINKRQPLIGPNDEPVRDRMLSGDLRPKVS